MPLKENLHPFEPGDWVWVKSFSRKFLLQPRWKGPFHILLTTQTVIKVAEKDAWIHWTHVKPAVLDHSIEPVLMLKLPPLRLQKNSETDKWALRTLFCSKDHGENIGKGIEMCYSIVPNIQYFVTQLTNGFMEMNLFPDKSNIWEYLAREMLNTTEFCLKGGRSVKNILSTCFLGVAIHHRSSKILLDSGISN